MITEQGRVIERSGSQVVISCRSRTDCPRCAAGKGCGGGLLARLLGDRLYQIRIPAAGDVAVGDQVTIGISESAFLQAATMIYLLPLLSLLAGAFIGDRLGGEPLAISGGVLATALMMLVLRRRLSRASIAAVFQPRILGSDQS